LASRGHQEKGSVREADSRQLRDLGRSGCRVGLRLFRFFAVDHADAIPDPGKRLGYTCPHAEQQPGAPQPERERQLPGPPVAITVTVTVTESVTVSVTTCAPVGSPAAEQRPGHRRRRHGRAAGHRAVRPRRGGDPGRRREHRLPQEDHQEPSLTSTAAGSGPRAGRES
jgi:hypothetical protein